MVPGMKGMLARMGISFNLKNLRTRMVNSAPGFLILRRIHD
jgi:hypothetical protein